MTDYTAYPLTWPAGWPRQETRRDAPFHRRVSREGQSWSSKEKLSIEQARTDVRHELRLLGAQGVVISSNLRLRLDGEPMSGQSNPDDPGVCVYFTLRKKPRCLPCDKWRRAGDNLVAISKYVEAMRGQIRWGVGSVDAMFAGFKALPGGDSLVTPPPMDEAQAAACLGSISGMEAETIMNDAGIFREAYRCAARKVHPDAHNGDTLNSWLEFQRAADVLRQYHGAE